MKPLVLSKYVFHFIGFRKRDSFTLKLPTIHRCGCFLEFFEWINPLSVQVYLGERELICDKDLISPNDSHLPIGVSIKNEWHALSAGSIRIESADRSSRTFYTYRQEGLNHIFRKENTFVVDKDIIFSLGIDAQLLYALCRYENKSQFSCNAKILMDDHGESKRIVDYEDYKRDFLDVAVAELKDSYNKGVCDLWIEYTETWKENKRKEKHPYPSELNITRHQRTDEYQVDMSSFDLSEIGPFEYIEYPNMKSSQTPEETKSTQTSSAPYTSQLIKRSSSPSYSELLCDPRWQKKSAEIKSRDDWQCQLCGRTDMQLVVHHLAYHAGHAPWEYEDGELLTICKECHSKLHRNKLSK